MDVTPSREAAQGHPGGRVEDRRDRKWIAREIERLDPVRDSQRIFALLTTQLMPPSLFAVHLYYTIGFVRFSAPPKAAIPVDRDGQGTIYSHGWRRADDSMYHLFGWVDYGADSEWSDRSIERVKQMHAAVAQDWEMPHPTFLHGTAVFTQFVDLFMRLVGAPTLTEKERTAQVVHWLQVAEKLGIRDVPDTWEGLDAFLYEYEHSEEFAYSEAGARMANGLIDDFARRWFHPRLRWLGRWLVLAFSEDHVLQTLRLEPPPRAVVVLMRAGARAGVFAKRKLLPDPPELIKFSDVFAAHPRSEVSSAQ